MGLVFQWKKKHGGVLQMENNAKAKSSMVYDVIDNSSGFYRLVSDFQHHLCLQFVLNA